MLELESHFVFRSVVIVASAGNSGNTGMGFPGAYEPVIFMSGTSFSARTIAGVVTLMLEKNGNLSNAEVPALAQSLRPARDAGV